METRWWESSRCSGNDGTVFTTLALDRNWFLSRSIERKKLKKNIHNPEHVSGPTEKTDGVVILWIKKFKKPINKWRLFFLFSLFFFARKIYTLCSEGCGIRRPPGRNKNKPATPLHRSVSLRHSSENRIGVRSSLSYTNVLHVSSLLCIITAVLFSIVNVPYKKRLSTCTFSPSVSTSSRRRFRAADGASSDARSRFIVSSTLTTSTASLHMIQTELWSSEHNTTVHCDFCRFTL